MLFLRRCYIRQNKRILFRHEFMPMQIRSRARIFIARRSISPVQDTRVQRKYPLEKELDSLRSYDVSMLRLAYGFHYVTSRPYDAFDYILHAQSRRQSLTRFFSRHLRQDDLSSLGHGRLRSPKIHHRAPRTLHLINRSTNDRSTSGVIITSSLFRGGR